MKIFKYFAILTVFSLFFSACASKKRESPAIRLNEVVHSVFYAPQYVALAKGFFEEEGLEIELTVGQGADKSMTAVISDNADIALLGTEAGIYVYNEGREDFAVPFAQLTQTAGNFLVAREANSDFSWEDVKGKTIIGGRAGGMPQMILEYVLAKNNITDNVEILTNLQFTSTAGAFAGGTGDYTAEFDPTAYALEKEGKGYVVASLGVESGQIPYTVYMATKSYIEKNPDKIQKFTNAIYKGQTWVNQHTAKEIAETISEYFKESSIEDLTYMIERYKNQNTWKETPLFDEEGFILIQDIMEAGGELSKRIDYKAFINNDFAEKAISVN